MAKKIVISGYEYYDKDLELLEISLSLKNKESSKMQTRLSEISSIKDSISKHSYNDDKDRFAKDFTQQDFKTMTDIVYQIENDETNQKKLEDFAEFLVNNKFYFPQLNGDRTY